MSKQMDDNDIVITSAFRTAIGSFIGSLSDHSAVQLGSEVIKRCIEHSNLKNNEVDMVYMGQVLQTGSGQNPARQSLINSGIENSKSATTINQVCGSGLAAVALGYNSLKLNDANIIIAGGQESMTNSPHYQVLRKGEKNEESKMKDSMLIDGLIDVYNQYHMGVTAENVAEKYQITRKEQDEFAVNSQSKASAAIKLNKFKNEIVPIKLKNGKMFDTDEYPKIGTNIEKLSTLKTVFKENGTVTAGNASGLNDGAAALTLMTLKTAKDKNLKPLAKIVSWAQCGVDPSIMGTGPIPASKLAIKKAGWTEDQIDLVEANEAFAAQAISVNKELGFNTEKVNVNGGAIALGHPLGCTGGKLSVQLINEMRRRKSKYGMVTMCVGTGQGAAGVIELLK